MDLNPSSALSTSTGFGATEGRSVVAREMTAAEKMICQWRNEMKAAEDAVTLTEQLFVFMNAAWRRAGGDRIRVRLALTVCWNNRQAFEGYCVVLHVGKLQAYQTVCVLVLPVINTLFPPLYYLRISIEQYITHYNLLGISYMEELHIFY